MTEHEHVFDDLPALLGGELDRPATGRVSAHLRACDDCRQELVLAVTAAAALRSAVRFAPQVVLDPDEALPDPTRFLAELAGEHGVRGEGGVLPDDGPSGVDRPGRDTDRDTGRDTEPDTGRVMDRDTGRDTGRDAVRVMDRDTGRDTGRDAVRVMDRDAGRDTGRDAVRDTERDTGRDPERDAGNGPAGDGRRRVRAWWTAAAAVVLLLVGIGAGVLISRRDNPAGPPARQVALRPVGSWTATGTVTMRGNRMQVDPTNLAPAQAGHFYEVWLVNRNWPTPKLVSVGVLNPGGDTWTLPESLVSAYTTVEISYEPDDGNPAYSGDSVLRGQYSS